MNSTQLFASGGIVMYPLFIASILVVTLGIERLYFWLKIGRRQVRAIEKILSLYEQQSIAIIDLLNSHRDLPLVRIFIAAIAIEDATPAEFRLAMESQSHQELPVLRRFHYVFDTVISLAPLFGLLGTIIGLINSFSALKIGSGGNGASNVAAGIGEALVATASGLIVAILASICANLFRSLYQRQLTYIQAATTQLELLHHRQWASK
jgi:biopolymer transport protein ExbB